MARIRIEDVTKTFTGQTAVDDVSLTVEDGEFMVLLGPSGCGKTTLLRMVAGFERPDAGSILIDDRDVTDLPPRARRIAMVFQNYALFPHMKVAENISFGLRMHHLARAETGQRVEKAAQMMQIGELLGRYPSQLSGGQRQRVAVARALAMEPAVLLMDEPLSNLDALLRMQMRAELKALLKGVGSTTIYVTHDQVEAMSMGDRTAVMNTGRILQVDTPMHVYDHPAEVFVARFIGSPPMNVLRAVAADGAVELEGHRLPLQPNGSAPGSAVEVGVRAENIQVAREPGPEAIEAKVLVVEPLGSHLLLTLELGEQQLKATSRTDFAVQAGDTVWVTPEPAALRLFA
ncbi:MAG: ABC transporter ATP-binding protein [Candidatus Dormibacteraeota bacterium]|nr:ABC transporter ATP-binding protein [Candidatus Dormibacteraeota bacterium]